MRWTPFALAAYAGLTSAHGDVPVLNVVGGRELLAELGIGPRVVDPGLAARAPSGRQAVSRRRNLESRQNTNGRCGGSRGSCAAGYCCSSEGWCGNDPDYCNAPDCQINYGPGCDGNKKPTGTDTTNIARPKNGNVAYGGLGIYGCVTKGDIAITFDDGPFTYTGDLLNTLNKYNAKATFFVTGINQGKGAINDATKPWPGLLKRMLAEGHQVASHTWSHQNSSQLTQAQMKNQMIYNEIAIANVLGFFPAYMRPPYSICEKQCQTVLASLGYHITYFDLDTEGYLHDDASQIQISKDIWDDDVGGANPATTSFLHIEHDLQYQVVYNLTEYILASLVRKGFKSVTVGKCLGDDPANWYRSVDKPVPSYPPPGSDFSGNLNSTATAGSSSSTSSSSSSATGSVAGNTATSTADATGTRTSSAAGPTGTLTGSTEGNCGNGVTCLGFEQGECCSQHGWCGTTNGHCGAGCQPAFGKCAAGNSASSSSSSTAQSATGTGSAPSSTSTLMATVDGNCGSGITCLGFALGECCSQYGWCGTTDGHCGAGCQSVFGKCAAGNSASSSSSSTAQSATGTGSAPSSTSTLTASVEGNCGSGVTCLGFALGECCSQYGWCGNTDGHCGGGCQSGFGKCAGGSSSAVGSSTSPSSSSSSSLSSSSLTAVTGSSSVAATTSASSSSSLPLINLAASSTSSSSSSSNSSSTTTSNTSTSSSTTSTSRPPSSSSSTSSSSIRTSSTLATAASTPSRSAPTASAAGRPA